MHNNEGASTASSTPLKHIVKPPNYAQKGMGLGNKVFGVNIRKYKIARSSISPR